MSSPNTEVMGRPVSTIETRKFRLEIVAAEDYSERPEGAPRLALFANSLGENRLVLYASPSELPAARREMVERGYRSTRSCCGGSAGYGSWRGYLNELDASHIIVELLAWTLTPEEQAALDAVDEYGRRKPTGFGSSRLT